MPVISLMASLIYPFFRKHCTLPITLENLNSGTTEHHFNWGVLKLVLGTRVCGGGRDLEHPPPDKFEILKVGNGICNILNEIFF